MEGPTIGELIADNYEDREVMSRLAEQSASLVDELEEAGIAHGDLKHGNIVVLGEGFVWSIMMRS